MNEQISEIHSTINPQFPVDLVTFTEEIRNGKLHFLCSDGPKALTYKATMRKLKPKIFSQFTPLFNHLVLTSYLSSIYLESWFSWLWGGVQKISKQRRKQTEEKH